MAPEPAPRHPLFARLILWVGAFLLPFVLAGLALLLPVTQRTITDLLLGHLFPGATVASAHLGWSGAQFTGIRLPAEDGVYLINRFDLAGSWWQLLWRDYTDQQQIRFDRLQFQPSSTAAPIGASQPVDLTIDGGVQDFPAEARRFVGTWKVQAAPQLPASVVPLSGHLVLHARDPLGPGVQPFAEADYTGALDAGFLWNLSVSSIATHDQVARVFALLPISANRQAAALRLMDAAGQLWKIHSAFTSLPGGGISWEIHATLWGQDDLASDFAALNLLTLDPAGRPVSDSAGNTEGPTIVLSGIGRELTSTNLAQLLLQMRQ
jgi:hypothetical protein